MATHYSTPPTNRDRRGYTDDDNNNNIVEKRRQTTDADDGRDSTSHIIYPLLPPPSSSHSQSPSTPPLFGPCLHSYADRLILWGWRRMLMMMMMRCRPFPFLLRPLCTQNVRHEKPGHCRRGEWARRLSRPTYTLKCGGGGQQVNVVAVGVSDWLAAWLAE